MNSLWKFYEAANLQSKDKKEFSQLIEEYIQCLNEFRRSRDYSILLEFGEKNKEKYFHKWKIIFENSDSSSNKYISPDVLPKISPDLKNPLETLRNMIFRDGFYFLLQGKRPSLIRTYLLALVGEDDNQIIPKIEDLEMRKLNKILHSIEKLDRKIQRLSVHKSSKEEPSYFHFLETLPDEYLKEYLGKIKDQNKLARILSFLKPEKTASLLNEFGVIETGTILKKIAELKPIPLLELEMLIEEIKNDLQYKNLLTVESGGISYSSSLIKTHLEKFHVMNVMTEIQSLDPEFATRLRESGFEFNDIQSLDNRAIQRVMRELDNVDLAKSLKGANEDIKNKIFSNMSQRAAELLTEDMEYMGPIPEKAILEARLKIVNIVKKLMSFGEIVFLQNGEEFVE